MADLLTPYNLRLLMGLTFFGLGLISVIAGLLMLGANPYRQEAKVLAAQSVRLTTLKSDTKGVTDSLASMAQSATALVEAVNALIRTSSGNAVVIIVVGVVCELAAYWLLVASL